MEILFASSSMLKQSLYISLYISQQNLFTRYTFSAGVLMYTRWIMYPDKCICMLMLYELKLVGQTNLLLLKRRGINQDIFQS